MRCAFTGPRPKSLPFRFEQSDNHYKSLNDRLTDKIAQLCYEGYLDFYCGMAIGCDLLCGEIVVSLMPRYSDIKLHAVVPFKGQADTWARDDQIHYQHLLQQCATQICLHDHYKNEYYMERNRYLVDNCDILLAVCDPDKIPCRSGTGATVRYAQAKGKQIIFVPPIGT